MIQGHGNAIASVLLIADGASKEDVQSNYALSGNSQILLEQVIGNKFKLGTTYRTCLIKEALSYTAAEDKTPYYEQTAIKEKASYYQNILVEEIKSIAPNLIIPLGELSFRLLTTLEGIRKFRGSVLLASPTLELGKMMKVLPILGPHIYNSEYKQRWVARIDFTKVPLYDNELLPNEQRHNIWIAKSSSALRTFLERSYTPEGLLVFDIETFMGMPTCISFCFDGQESVCVPFLDKSIDLDNRVLMIGQIARLLASPIRKVNQNIKYDWKVMERFGYQVTNVVGDTMLAASCIYPEFPKNLGFLTSIYTDIPYFKDEGRDFDPSRHKREQFYLYNAKDSLATHQIYNKQIEELNEMGSRLVYDNLVKLMPIYKQMEFNGIRYDDERRLRLLAKYETLFEINKIKLKRLVNVDKLNPLSHVQMARLVYDELGFKRTRQAQKTSEEELEWLAVYGTSLRSPIIGKEAIKILLNCRKIHKVIEYLHTVPYPDNKWRCEYNLTGTETGRSSAGTSTDQLITFKASSKGKKVVIESLGRSFQTIAKHGFFIDGEQYGKDLRSIFVPNPGYCYVEIDLSQAEARVDAVLSGNFDILSVFDGPIGIHRLTGSWVYDCDSFAIKKGTEQYHMAKTVRHAAERNMKEDRLVMMTQCLPQEAKRVLGKIHGKQPEIKQVFHRDVEECIRATLSLTAPNGRVRQFFDRIDQHTFNEGYSYLPQAIVSDQLKFALIPTFEEMGEKAMLINEAHDGALAEVLIDERMQYIDVFKKNVETEIDFRKCSLKRDFSLTIPSEASISMASWMDLEEVKV